MKHLFLILILALGWSVSNGQLYPPIQPYQENDYSIAEFKIFALAQTELSSNWRSELLTIVNNALAKAGEEVMVLDESSIYWILDHVTYERRNLVSFTNSRRIGNKIDFFLDHNYDGMVGIFNYGKCSLVIFKTRCMNLLKVPVQIIQVEPKPESTFSFSTSKQEDWSFITPRKVYENEIPVPDLNLIPQTKEKKFKWRPVIIIGGVSLGLAGVGYGIYSLLNHRGGPGGAPIIKDSGGPGGAPVTRPVVVPPFVPPVIPGGPGGAPITP